jgi:hypothetical protein
MATSVSSNHVQRHTTFVDLPTELILLIAQDLGNVDLVSLAVLCRRLHHIALPIYFKRHGVQDIRGNLKVAFVNGYLPGLKVALSLDSAREMEFMFPNSPHLHRNMREAAHLITRFTKLDEVRLNFWNLTCRQSGRSPQVANSQPDITALTPRFRELLDAIHAKSCTSFGVFHGRIEMDPGQSFDLAREMKTTSNVNIITSLIRKANLGAKGSDWRSPEFPGPPLSSLRTFHFESDLLLLQPLLNWTFQTLARSSRSLVELSLRDLCLKTGDWAYLLPHISLPSLATLNLSTASLDFSDLVLFLKRHSHIRLLSLRGGQLCTGHETPEPLPAGLFLALRRLRGPADYMVHLLRNNKHFPRLVDIDIRPLKCSSYPEAHLARQNDALALVAKLVPASKRIRITIALFREILYPRSERPVPVVSENEENTRSLSNVSSLALYRVDVAFTIHRNPALVARWLALFPALRDVTFSQQFFPATYDETNKCAFVEQIMVVWPKMENVAIGKDRRSVVTWRRSLAQTLDPN